MGEVIEFKDDGFVYMFIEDDEYELPIAIGDTVKELAKRIGVPESYVSAELKRSKELHLWCRFIQVPVNGEYELPSEKGRSPLARPVICIAPNGVKDRYESVALAARVMGVSEAAIRKFCKKGTGRGCEWRYEEIF